MEASSGGILANRTCCRQPTKVYIGIIDNWILRQETGGRLVTQSPMPKLPQKE